MIMPSTYAHYRFGRDVFAKLPQDVKKIIQGNEDLFNIGVHGPDLLFYFKPLTKNHVNRVGYGQHDKPACDFFFPAAKAIKRSGYSSACLSYIFGVICHFCLDRECHDYIDQKINESGVGHAEIECEFDRGLMVRDGLNPLSHILTKHIHPSKTYAAVISRFYSGISSDEIYAAMKSYIFYNRLMRCPNFIKRGLIYGALRIIGKYDSFHGMIVNVKPNPECKDSNEKLWQRYQKAIVRAVNLICDFCGNAEGSKPWSDIYNYTFGSKYIPNEQIMQAEGCKT